MYSNIIAHYTLRGYSDYTLDYAQGRLYLGGSDWLLKETKYPFDGSPVFDLAQYRYLSPKLMRVVVGSCANAPFYLQYNWHGNFYRWYAAGGGMNTFPYYGDEAGHVPGTICTWIIAPPVRTTAVH